MAAQEEDPQVFSTMAVQEDPQERAQFFAELSHRINPFKQLFEVAAEMRNATPLVQKSLSECFFSGAECDNLETKLREQHNIVMTSKQIRSKLNAAYYAFEEYCSLMKMGREGLLFDKKTGKVYSGFHDMLVPIAEKHSNIERIHIRAILNFNSLKAIFPFVWDNYFKDSSKKRSRSGVLGSSSKRSKETSSLKPLSSGNPNSDIFGKVLNRIQELYGDGSKKNLPKAYVDAAKFHYGADEKECHSFLAYTDDDAKADFVSKTNIQM